MGNTDRPQSGNRPLIQAMASQQKTIEAQKRQLAVQALQLAYIARVAGVTKELDAIRRQADIDNPAQPVPNPPSEAPVETTEEAVTPEAYDNPNQIGQTPGANGHVPAAAVDTPLTPGVTLPTSPYNQLENVSAPVAGTETHVAPDMTRIETDVRVGDPMNPETAYPLNPAFGPSAQQGTTPPASGEMSQTAGNRTMASLRLARLQLTAGIARGEDLEVAARIEANAGISDESIRTQIETLTAVVKASNTRTAAQRPAGVVPRAAAPQRQVQRTMPSLVAQQAPQQPITSVAGAVGAIDTEAEDVFL